MEKFDLTMLSGKELSELGARLGKLAEERPDITHRVLLGLKQSMSGNGAVGYGYGVGEILANLRRWWRFGLKKGD